MRNPKVSIGLPVYNGEKYLEEAIESILAQTFTDFELIISDNASTDRTAEICQKFVVLDSRVRYYRNENNIGGGNNHIITFKLSRGKYFRWANHDDISAPEFLAKCVEGLDHNPSVVLCYSVTSIIDEKGNSEKEIDYPIGNSIKSYERFRFLTRRDYHDCEPFYGLIRSSVLVEIMRKTGLNLNYTDADRTLLCQLSLYGPFFQIPELLFYKRYHSGSSTILYSDWRERVVWFFPNAEFHIHLPFLSQFFLYLKAITRSPISMKDKGYCYLHMVHWLFMEKGLGLMMKDLIFTGNRLVRYTYQKLQDIMVSPF